MGGVFTAAAWLRNILFAHTGPALAVPDGEVTLREEVAYGHVLCRQPSSFAPIIGRSRNMEDSVAVSYGPGSG